MPRKTKMAIALSTLLGSGGALANGLPDCVNGANTTDCKIPAGVTSMIMTVTGAGGGGGDGIRVDPINWGGGGGGGGGTCSVTLPVTPGQTLTIVQVGAGGLHGTPDDYAAGSQATYSAIHYIGDGGEGGQQGGANNAGGKGGAGTCPGGTVINGAHGGAGAGSIGGDGGAGGSPSAGQGGAGGSGLSPGTDGQDGAVILTFSGPVPTPTLSEWVQATLALLLAALAGRKLRGSRRR